MLLIVVVLEKRVGRERGGGKVRVERSWKRQ